MYKKTCRSYASDFDKYFSFISQIYYKILLVLSYILKFVKVENYATLNDSFVYHLLKILHELEEILIRISVIVTKPTS